MTTLLLFERNCPSNTLNLIFEQNFLLYFSLYYRTWMGDISLSGMSSSGQAFTYQS